MRAVHLEVVELIQSKKGEGVNGLREAFDFRNFLERLLDLQLGVDEPMIACIGIQFLLYDIQATISALTHGDKPFEELEYTGVALRRSGAARSPWCSCSGRWWRRNLAKSVGCGGKLLLEVRVTHILHKCLPGHVLCE
jgi:hypothetical protein